MWQIETTEDAHKSAPESEKKISMNSFSGALLLYVWSFALAFAFLRKRLIFMNYWVPYHLIQQANK